MVNCMDEKTEITRLLKRLLDNQDTLTIDQTMSELEQLKTIMIINKYTAASLAKLKNPIVMYKPVKGFEDVEGYSLESNEELVKVRLVKRTDSFTWDIEIYFKEILYASKHIDEWKKGLKEYRNLAEFVFITPAVLEYLDFTIWGVKW